MKTSRKDILTIATMWFVASLLATGGMMAIDWWLM